MTRRRRHMVSAIVPKRWRRGQSKGYTSRVLGWDVCVWYQKRDGTWRWEASPTLRSRARRAPCEMLFEGRRHCRSAAIADANRAVVAHVTGRLTLLPGPRMGRSSKVPPTWTTLVNAEVSDRDSPNWRVGRFMDTKTGKIWRIKDTVIVCRYEGQTVTTYSDGHQIVEGR